MTSMDITTQLSAENIDERSNKHLTLWKTDHNGCCPWGSLSISEEVVDERVSQVPVNMIRRDAVRVIGFVHWEETFNQLVL